MCSDSMFEANLLKIEINLLKQIKAGALVKERFKKTISFEQNYLPLKTDKSEFLCCVTISLPFFFEFITRSQIIFFIV